MYKDDMAAEQLPPLWTNQDIVLYHGTTVAAARAIEAGHIDLRYGRRGADFGPGFYTTTMRGQASRWARRIADERSSRPALVVLVLSREELTKLEPLAFVDGQFSAEQFWSFVYYCRSGATDHGRARLGGAAAASYDVVFGPVSRVWRLRRVFHGADQVSFHTANAVRVLNATAQRRMIEL
jgi:hypothetical protein